MPAKRKRSPGTDPADDENDYWNDYVRDRDDPTKKTDALLIKKAVGPGSEYSQTGRELTPGECVQFVDILQKIRTRPGIAIWHGSIDCMTGRQTLAKLDIIAQNNAKSESELEPELQWLATAKKEYDVREVRMLRALKAFEKDKAPVLDELNEMIEWFVQFFAHKSVENWEMAQEEKNFWVHYFTMVKYLAFGFGKNPADFEGFRTDCNPYLVDL